MLDYKEIISSCYEGFTSTFQPFTILNSANMAFLSIWQLARALFLPLLLLQSTTTNAVTDVNITDDTYFYGQSPPVYPSRKLNPTFYPHLTSPTLVINTQLTACLPLQRPCPGPIPGPPRTAKQPR